MYLQCLELYRNWYGDLCMAKVLLGMHKMYNFEQTKTVYICSTTMAIIIYINSFYEFYIHKQHERTKLSSSLISRQYNNNYNEKLIHRKKKHNMMLCTP